MSAREPGPGPGARPGPGPSRPSGAAQAARPTFRTWLAVFSLALGAAVIVTTEFLPVGFLPDVATDLHVTLGSTGLMVLVPGLGVAIAAPLVIVGAGRLDRRLLILVLGVLVLVSNAIAAVAPTLAVVLAARVLLGVAIGGCWAVVPSLGFRLTGPAAGVRATSIIIAGLSAGTVVGLPAGQFFGDLVGWRPSFAGVAAVAALIVLVQAVVLPRISAEGGMTFALLRRVFAVPIGRTVLVAGMFVTVGQFAASTFVTPFLLQNARMTSGVASLLFLGYGFAGVVGTLLGSTLVERSRMWTFVGAATAFGVILVALPLLAEVSLAVGVLFVAWGVIWGLVPLAMQTLMLTATPNTPEASSAVFITVTQLAIAVGSALGGVLVDSAGVTAVYVVSGAIAVLAGVFAAIARPRFRPDGSS